MARFVDIHTHTPSEGALRVTNFRLGVDAKPPCGLFSAGVHTWDAAAVSPILLEELQEALSHPNCVALGEIGLDRVCGVDWQGQLECFEAQLATSDHRPLIIHCVRAQSEVVATLKRLQPNAKAVVFHGFIGSKKQAEELHRLGYYTSFGFGALRSPRTMEALRTTPLHRLLLETDTSPQPIEELYAEVAKIKEIDLELLKESIENNFNVSFGISTS